jgi:hypothetical protein
VVKRKDGMILLEPFFDINVNLQDKIFLSMFQINENIIIMMMDSFFGIA